MYSALNVFLNAASDSVPNVRFSIANILKEVANLVDAQTVSTEIKP